MSAAVASTADILIVGGGIAGASAAYEAAAFATVIVIEREPRCGYHSTGRSAASFSENYGNDVVRRLAMASRGFLENPPPGFCEQPLLRARGTITIARADQIDLLERKLRTARTLVPAIAPLDPASAIARVPILRQDYVAGAFIEPDAREIDVDALHQGYLRGARQRGARIVVGADVQAIARDQGRWAVATERETFAAPVVINAAGAWADRIAALAGIRPVGLQPKKRTAFLVPVPPHLDIRGWPLVDDVGEEFYFKSEAGRLFVSPSDATASEPADVYPDDLDVALGVERLERATTLTVERVTRSWAGLRTFAADMTPVVGQEPDNEGFYWLAGQGGYGIKTSPALSRSCTALIREGRIPEDVAKFGVTAPHLSPQRLRAAAGACHSLPA